MMIGDAKDYYKHLIDLWQSKNKNFQNMKIAILVIFVLAIMCFATAFVLKNQFTIINSITKVTFIYFGILMIIVMVDLLYAYFYVYNDIKCNTRTIKLSANILILLLVISVLVAIPFMIVLKILDIVLNKGAKKIDNLISFLIYSLVALIVVAAMIFLNSMIASYSLKSIAAFLNAYKWNIDVLAAGIFMVIVFTKFEADIVFNIILHGKVKTETKRNEKRFEVLNKVYEKRNLRKDMDLTKYYEDKKKYNKDEETKFKSSLEYDITYLKYTLWISELAILILSFVILSFKIYPQNLMNFFNQYQNDVINNITIITLILLYVDKRKEWDVRKTMCSVGVENTCKGAPELPIMFVPRETNPR